ncbi:MAG: hypothetical protein ACXWPM_12050 [Bdellovibrionota bacterium]
MSNLRIQVAIALSLFSLVTSSMALADDEDGKLHYYLEAHLGASGGQLTDSKGDHPYGSPEAGMDWRILQPRAGGKVTEHLINWSVGNPIGKDFSLFTIDGGYRYTDAINRPISFTVNLEFAHVDPLVSKFGNLSGGPRFNYKGGYVQLEGSIAAAGGHGQGSSSTGVSFGGKIAAEQRVHPRLSFYETSEAVMLAAMKGVAQDLPGVYSQQQVGGLGYEVAGSGGLKVRLTGEKNNPTLQLVMEGRGGLAQYKTKDLDSLAGGMATFKAPVDHGAHFAAGSLQLRGSFKAF